MSERVLQVLKDKFGSAILETHSQFGDETAVVEASRWHEICLFLRDDPQMNFDMFVDMCGVDYPEREPRMEVVLHLYSIARRHRLRLKTRVGDSEMDGAEVDTVTDVWSGANWFEREVYDLSGVTFKGHPDLRRILMYPEFEGHPLRKDYPANKTQPLVPYRTEAEAGLPLEKIAPFRADEGMPFGRRGTWGQDRGES
ncbi:NADH-ubiquinone oxidoreductase chain C [Labilithrix luteola]|uniref:NADH-quinone oxidoreductase subunit C n=1 Tax=Labilithrix luteola TaxID=1391654 RepID=A0A0K1Q9P6_9BACT|nr:NADH-quinone oxidoreductase subunit C [Labilithrix luteola]AKV02516.1 NADH-ubiquinone oxidoreductase chain C [Labilithrix luteola]